jgi:hypothetical protein
MNGQQARGDTRRLATIVADAAAPVDLRGTAFGFFNLLNGLTMLIAGTG